MGARGGPWHLLRQKTASVPAILPVVFLLFLGSLVVIPAVLVVLLVASAVLVVIPAFFVLVVLVLVPCFLLFLLSFLLSSCCSWALLLLFLLFLLRSKFTTRSIFSTAGWFTIAARLVRTPFSWELQTFFLSKKGPRRSKFGGRSKNTTA